MGVLLSGWCFASNKRGLDELLAERMSSQWGCNRIKKKSQTINDSSDRKENHMKQCMLIATLLAIFVPTSSFGEEQKKKPTKAAVKAKQQMQQRNIEIELEVREIELN